MRRMTIIAASSLLMSMASPVFADTVTFGQFLQKAPSARLFRYANHDAGAVKSAEIYSTPTASSTAHGSIPVFFVLSAVGLPADLVGMQDAHLSIDFFSNSGTTGTGTERVQAFNNGTISIVRDVAAAEGLGSRTNLLTVTFTNAELDAAQNAGAFTFKSNTSSTITYSSDFLDFSHVVTKDFSFSFSGASPRFSAALGSSSVNTRFSGTGTFASDPAPLTFSVPEISSWAMLIVGFGAVGATLRTGRRRRDLFA